VEALELWRRKWGSAISLCWGTPLVDSSLARYALSDPAPYPSYALKEHRAPYSSHALKVPPAPARVFVLCSHLFQLRTQGYALFHLSFIFVVCCSFLGWF